MRPPLIAGENKEVTGIDGTDSTASMRPPLIAGEN